VIKCCFYNTKCGKESVSERYMQRKVGIRERNVVNENKQRFNS